MPLHGKPEEGVIKAGGGGWGAGCGRKLKHLGGLERMGRNFLGVVGGVGGGLGGKWRNGTEWYV